MKSLFRSAGAAIPFITQIYKVRKATGEWAGAVRARKDPHKVLPKSRPHRNTLFMVAESILWDDSKIASNFLFAK